MLWDVFCRVVDNWGDIGVGWRCARDLASRGEQVRLWIDDASALTWMAPGGAAGVDVIAWQADVPAREPGDVVVELFGCDPPSAFVERMRQRAPAPLWINLEYLSAEPYVERSHGLPSPQQAGPGRGLTKWFWYPGFTPATGGLIREPGLLDERARFDRAAWFAAHAIEPRAGERVVSLFCYDNAALPALLDTLAAGATPTLLLLTPGHAARQAQAALGPSLARGALRALRLPWLTQPDFDRLLWACDLDFVRGEDSFVRAQWAAQPFVWHVYPQDDAAHARKLDAFLDLYLEAAPSPFAAALRALWFAWIGRAPWPAAWPDAEAWAAHARRWQQRMAAREDLVTQLLRFAGERRGPRAAG